MEHIHDVVVIGGGQAGLAAGYHLKRAGLCFVMLEANAQAGGSWPGYYDSLTLFSPARHSALPGMPFPAAPEHYPTRDEVTTYLRTYAERLALPLQTDANVQHVQRVNHMFEITTADGTVHRARTLIAATGGFGRPYSPDLPGLGSFQGQVLHAAAYRHPEPFAGKRVVVVGGANSAVQIGVELAGVARVTLATRHPLRFVPQHWLGHDIHDWLNWTGLDYLPQLRDQGGMVLDAGQYRAAFAAGKLDQRPMFLRSTATGVAWTETEHESIDVLLLATGYRPHLPFLRALGALDEHDLPLHTKGISATVPGLYYVGLSGQRSFRSATLRGVGPDAAYVVKRLRRYLATMSTAAHPHQQRCCSFGQGFPQQS